MKQIPHNLEEVLLEVFINKREIN
jgi:hypothetical protein